MQRPDVQVQLPTRRIIFILSWWLARNTMHPAEPYTGPRPRRSSPPPVRFGLFVIWTGFPPGRAGGGLAPPMCGGPPDPSGARAHFRP